MASPIQQERSVWYFSQSQGWMLDREPADAKYRLTAIGRNQSYVQIENSLEVVNPRGGWNEVTPDIEATLPAVERGYVFVTKPLQNDKGSFVQIESKRYLDENMIRSFFDGLTIFDIHGDVMGEPLLAFGTFCLERRQADAFYERVKTRGGQVNEAQADLHAMYESLQKLEGLYKEMEQICNLSRAVIDRVAEGIRSEAPSISERSRMAHYLRDQATEIVDFIRSEKMTLDQQPGQIEHRGFGGAYLEHAEQWLGHIEKLHREHKSYEIQAVSRIQEAMSQSLPSIDAPASTRRYLFIPVVEYYAEMNIDCRLTAEGMVMRIGDTTIELGETVKILGTGVTDAPTPTQQTLVDRGERSL
jgi:hypothetical protein